MNTDIDFKVGDIVTRKKIQAFRYGTGDGTVVKITEDGRCKIKWFIKQKTGQQHSTIQPRFLELLNRPS